MPEYIFTSIPDRIARPEAYDAWLTVRASNLPQLNRHLQVWAGGDGELQGRSAAEAAQHAREDFLFSAGVEGTATANAHVAIVSDSVIRAGDRAERGERVPLCGKNVASGRFCCLRTGHEQCGSPYEGEPPAKLKCSSFQEFIALAIAIGSFLLMSITPLILIAIAASLVHLAWKALWP